MLSINNATWCNQGTGGTSSTLNRALVLVTVVVPLLLALIQLAMGTSPVVLLVAYAIIGIGGLGFYIWRIRHIGAVLLLAYVTFTIVIGIVLKTILGQPLDSYLDAPLLTFAVCLFATLGFFAALVFAEAVSVGRPLFNPNISPQQLKRATTLTATIGFGVFILNQFLAVDPRVTVKTGTQGFGGLIVFQNLVYFAIICATQRRILISRRRSTVDFNVVVLIAGAVLMALVDNTKIDIAKAILAYALPVVFTRRRISGTQISIGLISLLLLVVVVAPMMGAMRSDSFRRASLGQRWDIITQAVSSFGEKQSLGELAADTKDLGYKYGTSYFGGGFHYLVGRFVQISWADPVVSAAARDNYRFGPWIFADAFKYIIPSAIYPAKPVVPLEDKITWRLELRKTGIVGFPVVPLSAYSYAGVGVTAAFIIPFFVFSLLLVELKKLGWRLGDNVYAMFFVVVSILSLHNLSFGNVIALIFRTLPLLAVLLGVCTFVVRLRIRRGPAVDGS